MVLETVEATIQLVASTMVTLKNSKRSLGVTQEIIHNTEKAFRRW